MNSIKKLIESGIDPFDVLESMNESKVPKTIIRKAYNMSEDLNKSVGVDMLTKYIKDLGEGDKEDIQDVIDNLENVLSNLKKVSKQIK